MQTAMSNRPKLKPPGRNLAVLLARGAAEFAHGLTGVNMLVVRHDDWCSALVTRSMLDCRCSPEIVIEPIDTTGDGILDIVNND